MKRIADKVFENITYAEYRALTIEAEKHIRALFADVEIKPDISSRTKTIQSINDKIDRNGYADFEKEMKDISGVRIAYMTKQQKEDAVKLLKEKFVLVAHEPSKEDPYSMGYKDEKLILCLGHKFGSRDYASIRDKKLKSKYGPYSWMLGPSFHTPSHTRMKIAYRPDCSGRFSFWRRHARCWMNLPTTTPRE